MVEDIKRMGMMDNNIMNILFPYKVYKEHGIGTPEGGPLWTLEAGFFEKDDAEFYIEQKSLKTGKNYLINPVLEVEEDVVIIEEYEND